LHYNGDMLGGLYSIGLIWGLVRAASFPCGSKGFVIVQ